MTSDSPVVVRRPTPDDLPRVIELESISFADPWSSDSLREELTVDVMRRPLVAEVHGVICGYLFAWRVADTLHILNLATDPDRRRAGIASALLRAAAEAAAKEGQDRLTLEVRRSNAAARAFYTRWGFAEVGVRSGYYADNGEDALILAAETASLDDDRN